MTVTISELATKSVTDVACTYCGCVCDDLRVDVTDNRVVRLENACPLAEAKLISQDDRNKARCLVNGVPSSHDEACVAAAKLLQNSVYPLVYGLSSSGTEGQRAACHLADRLGGAIDPSASSSHVASVMAMQRVGESTSSLGEVRNRSDLVIFWGANPVQSLPRHLERYSDANPEEFLNSHGKKRFLIVVDTVKTETAEQADLFIQIEPGSDFDVLWALRAIIQGDEPSLKSVGGLSKSQLLDLTQRLMSCGYGAVFFGEGLTRGILAHMNVEALFGLVTDLQRHTRFVVSGTRSYGEVAGADNVLTWQTGYPFSVDLSRGYPRYNPGEFSAGPLLERQQVDMAVLVGSGGITKLPPAALQYLSQIPTILLSHEDVDLPISPTVFIPVATYGVHLAGTVYRMDKTPIPLRPFLESELPSDAAMLTAIIDHLSA